MAEDFIDLLEKMVFLGEVRPDSVGNDSMAGTGLGWAEWYQFDQVHFFVESPDGEKRNLHFCKPEDGQFGWLRMCERYGKSEEGEPNMETDYVIETAGGIHQKFHVTPMRQDYYVWNQAILAIAEHDPLGQQKVWLLDSSTGNFSSVNINDELRRILSEHQAQEQARPSGSEDNSPDEG